jgi:transcriptional regulator with XRE-family HTH domain
MCVEAGPLPDSGKILLSLQAKFSKGKLRECREMPKHPDHIAEGLAAFSSAARTLMKLRNLKSEAELARLVSGKAPKSVNNALSGRHDAQISTLQAIADALDCPLWVMFLVGKAEKDLESPYRERLIKMVESYLKCDDEGRHHVESLAAAFAAKSRPNGKHT